MRSPTRSCVPLWLHESNTATRYSPGSVLRTWTSCSAYRTEQLASFAMLVVASQRHVTHLPCFIGFRSVNESTSSPHCFKVHKLHQPSYLSAAAQVYLPQRTLRSTTKELFIIPLHKTLLGSRRFYVAVPTVWNKLSTVIVIVSRT